MSDGRQDHVIRHRLTIFFGIMWISRYIRIIHNRFRKWRLKLIASLEWDIDSIVKISMKGLTSLELQKEAIRQILFSVPNANNLIVIEKTIWNILQISYSWNHVFQEEYTVWIEDNLVHIKSQRIFQRNYHSFKFAMSGRYWNFFLNNRFLKQIIKFIHSKYQARWWINKIPILSENIQWSLHSS